MDIKKKSSLLNNEKIIKTKLMNGEKEEGSKEIRKDENCFCFKMNGIKKKKKN